MLSFAYSILPDDPESVMGWISALGLSGVIWLRLRRDRAGTREREKLADMRIAHAEETGDLHVLEKLPVRSVLSEWRRSSVPGEPNPANDPEWEP